MHRSGFAFLALGAVLLMTTACGEQETANAANSADGGNRADAGAKAGPHPVTMEPDPANQTGPVARAVDADFPEPCQAYVRDTQSCIDALQGPTAVERTRELRLQLHANRGTWLSVRDRAGLISICRDNLGMLRERRRAYNC